MKQWVVVGGGLSGLVAARELVLRGPCRVTVLESLPMLGGKAASWRGAGGLPVEVGLHVCFRHYRHLRNMLRELAVEEGLAWGPRALQYVGPGGRVTRMRFPRLPSPLHGLVALMRLRELRWTERLSGVMGMAEAVLGTPQRHACYEDLTFAEWAHRRGMSKQLLAGLLEPIVGGLTFLRSDEVSARTMLAYIRAIAADAGDCDIACFRGGSGVAIVAPLAADLRRRGVELHTGCEVQSIVAQDGRVAGVRACNGDFRPADGVVVAVPAHRLQPLFEAPLRDHPAVVAAARLRPVPVASVVVGFDRQVPGPGGLRLSPGTVFNTWVDLIELHSEVAAASQSVLQFVVAPMTPELEVLDDARLVGRVLADLRRVLPAAAGARVLDSAVTRTPESFHASVPGAEALRPAADIGVPGLALAGDYVGAGRLPNLESAVAAGIEAARTAHWAMRAAA